MADLPVRLMCAVAMFAVVAIALFLGPWAVGLLIFTVTALMLAEWWRMVHQETWPSFETVFSAASYRSIERPLMYLWVPYIILAGILGWWIYSQFDALHLLWLVVCVAAADTGAFFAGRLIGGPKLMPKVSPKKTISGALGGILGAIVASLVFKLALSTPGSLSLHILIIGTAAIAVASQAGDLLESWAKRLHGIKDSSALLPGHGGFLDRLDGLMGALPIAAFLLWISS